MHFPFRRFLHGFQPFNHEEAVESISQDTQDTQIQWSLFSLFHPALQTIFSMRFPVFFAVSLAAFFCCYLVLSATQDLHYVLVVALMFTSPHPLRRRAGKQTPAAPELQLFEDLSGSAISRNCFGTCLSRNLRRVHSIATQTFS